MKLSVIVHLAPEQALPFRFLLHSLQQQTQTEIEVLVFAEKGQSLPNLPESWQQHLQDSPLNAAQLWEKALATAQGEYIAFVQTPVQFDPRHFELCLKALAQGPEAAVATQVQFLDQEALPVQRGLPLLQSSDWPGFCLASRLSWPLEACVFKKTALSAESLDTQLERLSVAALLPWIREHALRVLPVKSLSAPLLAFWQAELSAKQLGWLQNLVEQTEAESLLPAYARHEALPVAAQAHDFVCQALRNKGLWEILEKYRQRQQLGLEKQVFWVVKGEARPWLKLLQGLPAQGYKPVVIVATEQAAPEASGFSLEYTQQAGVPVVNISGLTAAVWQPVKTASSELDKWILELFLGYRPAAVHFTTLAPFSSELLLALAHSNTPVYVSLTDDSLSCYRDWLRHPEQMLETARQDKTQAPAYIQQIDQHLTHFLRHLSAGNVAHRPVELDKWRALGLPEDNLHLVQNAEALGKLYQRPVVMQLPPQASLFPELFQSRFGQDLTEHIKGDLGKIDQKARVLVAGYDINGFVHMLADQQVWAQGCVLDPQMTERAQSLGLPVYNGNLTSLSERVHYFDTLYTPFLLETLSTGQWRHLLTAVVMSLRKKGRWLLRCVHPIQLRHDFDAFWLSEHHRRPYSPGLLKLLLEHAGFEVQAPELGLGKWQDIFLEATLKTESLPLVNLPQLTPELADYWESHPPGVTLEENDRVLMVGQRLFKSWLIYRVQADYLLGITLDLNDLNKRQKPSKMYHFRHSSNLNRTLGQLEGQYSLIVLQGVVETCTPTQLQELLKHCRNHLTPEGRLYIETLQLDLQSDDPLFWQSLLHVRPYPELSSLLQACGFEVDSSSQRDQHLVYNCRLADPVAVSFEPPAWPAQAQKVLALAEQPVSLSNLAALRKLPVDSVPVLQLYRMFEQLPLEHLQAGTQKVLRALQTQGAVSIAVLPARPQIWQDPFVQRPYPVALLKKLLQRAGLQEFALEHSEQADVWTGFERLKVQKLQRQGLQVRWEGDVFNYHSLATVNRELLQQWLKQDAIQLEIESNLDPAFEPAPEDASYPLYQRLANPLLQQPDLIVRHQWPPEFNPPQSLGHWVMIQPWEFGALPERWVYNMNKFVDQVWVPSEFVKQSYLRSGILPEKVAVVSNGVDTQHYTPKGPALKLPTKKKFKFLYVGGGILRKGVDLLLNAYVEAFSASDNVCLVVKEFGAGKVYRSIEIAEWIERYRKNNPDMPEILHFTDELGTDEMPALYRAADCLVHPYRGEGFALPIAEAMACEKPVVVTGYGACLDYCNADNAYLIPAEEVRFKDKQIDETLITVDHPYWAEPDYEALKALLKEVYSQPKEAAKKAKKARKTIVSGFSWAHSVKQMQAQIAEIKERPVFRLYREHTLAEILGKAFAAFEQNDFVNAVPHLKHALQIDPYQPSVLYNLGIAHLMLNQYEDSLEALTRSLREGDITGDLCYAMGTVLRHLGDHKTSQDFFNKARELEPELFVAV